MLQEINKDGAGGGHHHYFTNFGAKRANDREDRHTVIDRLRYWGQAGPSIREQISNQLRHRVLP